MPGYNPNCGNCFKCMTCRGDGTVMRTRSETTSTGKQVIIKERVTCSTCRGVGGKPGAGTHKHK